VSSAINDADKPLEQASIRHVALVIKRSSEQAPVRLGDDTARGDENNLRGMSFSMKTMIS
jgi:hypothetical protein